MALRVSTAARVTVAFSSRSAMGDDAAEPCAGAEEASALGAVWVERAEGGHTWEQEHT